MQNGSSAYLCAWYGHQRSTLLELEKASIFNSLSRRLLEKVRKCAIGPLLLHVPRTDHLPYRFSSRGASLSRM